jgi:predicted amidophosphoribosyltransferase
MNSHIAQKYIHYYGNESSESLLEAYSIVTKNAIDTLEPKICPNCNEGNTLDARFCSKCKVLKDIRKCCKNGRKRTKKDLHSFKQRMASIENMLVVLKGRLYLYRYIDIY